MWSCWRIIQCNSSDLNTVTPEVTERGQNLYKRDGRRRWRWGLPQKVCITHLSYLTSSHKLCLSVTSSSCPSCWVMFKFSSWGQSRELTWNFSWQSPHLFCFVFFFLFVSSKLCFLQHFFVQHSSQGLAKAERLTKLLHMQRYKHTRCVIPTAGAGFETVTSWFLLYFRKWRCGAFCTEIDTCVTHGGAIFPRANSVICNRYY